MRKPLLIHITTVPTSLAFLTGQVEYIKARGLEVHLVSSPGEDLHRFGALFGVAASAVPMSRRISPLADLVSLVALVRTLRRLNAVIVHAHTPKAGLLGMIAAWLTGVPVRVYHMHGLPLMTATGAKRVLLRWTEKVACALAHRVVCVSHSLRQVALELSLCKPEKITVLLGGSANGVDAADRFNPRSLPAGTRQEVRARYGIPDTAIVLGFVGRVVGDKGIAELVKAWLVLREEFPNLRLLIVGPFESQDPLPAWAETIIRTDPRVHLAGMDWNTPPLYAAMDIVVLPTYREGFPNVPLEAAAMELPIVATTVPGCVDAVKDGITGILVPPRDAVALANALRVYIRDPELRRVHGLAGRDRVLRDFKREDIWEGIWQEYVTLLRQRGLDIQVNRGAQGEVMASVGA